MDRFDHRKLAKIGPQIVDKVLALNGRGIAEEAHDAAFHQPGIVAMRKIPQMVVRVDNTRWGTHG